MTSTIIGMAVLLLGVVTVGAIVTLLEIVTARRQEDDEDKTSLVPGCDCESCEHLRIYRETEPRSYSTEGINHEREGS